MKNARGLAVPIPVVDVRRPLMILWPIVALALALAFATAPSVGAAELGCEAGDNQEGGCCCFLKAHTYEFDAVPVSKLEITFDTGSGLDCRGRVALQVRDRGEWRTVRAVDAVSGAGRSHSNRISGTLTIDDSISGVRIDDGGRCYVDYSKISYQTTAPGQRPGQGSGQSAALGARKQCQR
ncbi:MAG: hypothetical protein GY719_08205 [bacterium]|nr:hypothetical protein [bacterium]